MLAHQITAETRYRRYAPRNLQEPAKTR